ncbi:MAG TPA: lipoprotein LpqV [Mycobacterium sp.]|nr:lipoprotein LpqV [Mycobacterium sp.]
MRRCSQTTLLSCATLAAAASLFSAGCSSATDDAVPSTATPNAAVPSAEPAQPGPVSGTGATGISPDGVTTSVDVPSEATESQYGQACHAARLWLAERHEDPKTLVEPYLKTLQDPNFVGPGNFDTPWSQLTPAQQAGVIMAANAAADGQCD